MTCCRCCQQVPRLAGAWQGRTVATTAALPQQLTAAFLRAGAEAVVCARDPGQDAAAPAAFFRHFYQGVLGGRLSIVDALSAAGEASLAAVCQPLDLPKHELRSPCQKWSRHTACDRLLCSARPVISCFSNLSTVFVDACLRCRGCCACPEWQLCLLLPAEGPDF